MMKIAVLLTVFNRREVTLRGLRSLYNYKAIDYLGEGYQFDIYMTDDGCTDGTSEAVVKEFPDVHIIQGDGNLYWSGGMRKAWQAAIGSGIHYDYFLWFNDDAELYDDALVVLFSSMKEAGENSIISGAFCDREGNATYGGWSKGVKIMDPNGTLQPIFLMNGNLVLIPCKIAEEIGIIDSVFKHSLGDWDYGRRAVARGFKVLLTPKFVGVTERHDEKDNRCFKRRYTLPQRWKYLHSAKFSPKATFVYNYRHEGLLRALLYWGRPYIYTLCPNLYSLRHKK